MRGAILILTGLLLAAAGPAFAQAARKMAEHGDWGQASAMAASLMTTVFAVLLGIRLLTAGRLRLFEI